MKKYTLENYKEFCDKALICPPFEDDEQIDMWLETHKVYIIANDCMMELDYYADVINELDFGLKEMYEAIYGDGTPTTGNTAVKPTTQDEFKTKLLSAFKTHMFMKDRDKHTVNELIYILRYDDAFKGKDFNISIRKKSGEWWSIPSLDCLVTISCLSVWFEDEFLEFEIEECGEEQFNCITIYESEGV